MIKRLCNIVCFVVRCTEMSKRIWAQCYSNIDLFWRQNHPASKCKQNVSIKLKIGEYQRRKKNQKSGHMLHSRYSTKEELKCTYFFGFFCFVFPSIGIKGKNTFIWNSMPHHLYAWSLSLSLFSLSIPALCMGKPPRLLCTRPPVSRSSTCTIYDCIWK